MTKLLFILFFASFAHAQHLPGEIRAVDFTSNQAGPLTAQLFSNGVVIVSSKNIPGQRKFKELVDLNSVWSNEVRGPHAFYQLIADDIFAFNDKLLLVARERVEGRPASAGKFLVSVQIRRTPITPGSFSDHGFWGRFGIRLVASLVGIPVAFALGATVFKPLQGIFWNDQTISIRSLFFGLKPDNLLRVREILRDATGAVSDVALEGRDAAGAPLALSLRELTTVNVCDVQLIR